MRALLCCLALFFAGCTHNPPALHPGAVNQFDSQAYDTLVTIQAALDQASKEVVAFPALKPQFNKVIDGYNAAQRAYKAYHEAAVAGRPADQAALNTLIQNLSAAVADIVKKLHSTSTLPSPQASLVWRYA